MTELPAPQELPDGIPAQKIPAISEARPLPTGNNPGRPPPLISLPLPLVLMMILLRRGALPLPRGPILVLPRGIGGARSGGAAAATCHFGGVGEASSHLFRPVPIPLPFPLLPLPLLEISDATIKLAVGLYQKCTYPGGSSEEGGGKVGRSRKSMEASNTTRWDCGRSSLSPVDHEQAPSPNLTFFSFFFFLLQL